MIINANLSVAHQDDGWNATSDEISLPACCREAVSTSIVFDLAGSNCGALDGRLLYSVCSTNVVRVSGGKTRTGSDPVKQITMQRRYPSCRRTTAGLHGSICCLVDVLPVLSTIMAMDDGLALHCPSAEAQRRGGVGDAQVMLGWLAAGRHSTKSRG
jgi:hypothetical protein